MLFFPLRWERRAFLAHPWDENRPFIRIEMTNRKRHTALLPIWCMSQFSYRRVSSDTIMLRNTRPKGLIILSSFWAIYFS